MNKSVKQLLVKIGMPLCLAGCILVSGCGTNDSPPKDLLTKDQMVKALSEIYLSEQRISSLGVKRDSLRKIFMYLQPKALAKVGTNDSTFKHSFDYYKKNPKVIEQIYSALIDTLNLHEQRLISNQVKP